MKNLIDSLKTEEQFRFAQEVADKAKLMGVDPRLALALAFRESKLDPAAIGKDGEIGLMQVLPSTAKDMGFSIEELRDPSKNIEIGLTYLKQNLDKFEGDPRLAAAAYNAGPNHPFFRDAEKPLPASTQQYLADIQGFGGFTPTPVESKDDSGDDGGGDGKDELNEYKMRMLLDAAGAGTGAVAAKVSDVGRGVVGGARDLVRASRTLPGALSVLETLTRTGQPPAAPAMSPIPPAPAASAPQAGALRPVVGGPAGPVGGPPAPLSQMGGSATYNYGKAFGLTDIEANRATDMSKQPGGASDLIAKRTEALQKIQQMGGGFVENPNYGGIMTPDRGVGAGPRASFTQQSAIPPSPDLPSGRQPGLAQLPPTAPISAAPPAPPTPSPLAQAAGAVKQGAGAVLRSPLTQGALGGISIAESAQEADRRIREKDPTGAAIAGSGMMGGAMQIFGPPHIKAIGAFISAASPLTLYLRENLQKQTPMPAPTEAELLAAQKPAFIYARP